MAIEHKIKDYPHLRKVNGAVINKDDRAYAQAKAQAKASGRLRQLEMQVNTMSSKIDDIIGLLSNYRDMTRVA